MFPITYRYPPSSFTYLRLTLLLRPFISYHNVPPCLLSLSFPSPANVLPLLRHHLSSPIAALFLFAVGRTSTRSTKNPSYHITDLTDAEVTYMMRCVGNRVQLHKYLNSTVAELEAKLVHPTVPSDSTYPWSAAHLEDLIAGLPDLATRNKFIGSLDWSVNKADSALLKATISTYFQKVRDVRARQCKTCFHWGLLDEPYQKLYKHKGKRLPTDIFWSKTKSAQARKQYNCVRCCLLVGGDDPTSLGTPDRTDASLSVDETHTTPEPELSPNEEDRTNDSQGVDETQSPPQPELSPNGEDGSGESEGVPATQTQPEPEVSPNAEDVLRQSNEVRDEIGAEALESIRSELVALRVGGLLVQSIDLGTANKVPVDAVVIEAAKQLINTSTNVIFDAKMFSSFDWHGCITHLGLVEATRLNAPISTARRHVIFGHLSKFRDNIPVRSSSPRSFMCLFHTCSPCRRPSQMHSCFTPGCVSTYSAVSLLGGLHAGYVYRHRDRLPSDGTCTCLVRRKAPFLTPRQYCPVHGMCRQPYGGRHELGGL